MPKTRKDSVRTEKAGVIAVDRYCNDNNLIFQGAPREDYGIDGYVEVLSGNHPQGFFIGVQVKSGPSYRRCRSEQEFSISVSADDVAYWQASNVPVIFAHYHEEQDEIYFKHIQQVFSERAMPTSRTLTFGPEDRASCDRLADYARRLAAETPSVLHRVQVLEKDLEVVLGDRMLRLPVSDPDQAPRLSLSSLEIEGRSPDALTLPRDGEVIGYGRNGWICTSVLRDDAAADGFDFSLRFQSLEEHTAIDLALLGSSDPEDSPLEDLDVKAYSRMLGDAKLLATSLDMRRATTLFSSDGLQEENHYVAPVIRFGAVEFELSVGPAGGRDALLFTAGAFLPPRVWPFLIQNVTPVYMISGDPHELETGGYFTLDKPRRFERIRAMYSDGVKWISVAIESSDSHVCWGTRETTLVHLSIDDIRHGCTRALTH